MLNFLSIFSSWYISLGAGRGLELRGRSPSRPKPHLTPDDASGADCVRAFLFCGFAACFDFKISCRKNRKISIALQIGAVFC